ncbi:unnamed protein product [Ectocarpus sp. 6 AP-2014]
MWYLTAATKHATVKTPDAMVAVLEGIVHLHIRTKQKNASKTLVIFYQL